MSVGGRDRAATAVLLATALVILGFSMGLKYLRVAKPAPTPLVEVRSSDDLRVIAASVAGRWVGTISGNDPSVRADVALTQSGSEVHGVLLWDSPNSGRNERRIAGWLDPERRTLILRDVAMPSAQANGMWRFCAVDYYLLELAGDELTGGYWSAACNDRARMRLRRAR